MASRCVGCGVIFEPSAREIEGLKEYCANRGLFYLPPRRCSSCRRAARVVVDDGVDQELTCLDCGRRFAFIASEKAHFARVGFPAPIRCRRCRARRKAESVEAGTWDGPSRPALTG